MQYTCVPLIFSIYVFTPSIFRFLMNFLESYMSLSILTPTGYNFIYVFCVNLSNGGI